MVFESDASLRLRIDEVVDDSTVKTDPSYGPVFIQAPLTCGDWWRCIVTSITENYITAENTKYIPRDSDIPKGPIPEDPTQSLTDLISGQKLRHNRMGHLPLDQHTGSTLCISHGVLDRIRGIQRADRYVCLLCWSRRGQTL